MREGDLYAPIIRGAMSEGWLLYRLTEGINKAPADIAGCIPGGRACLVEVKLDKAKNIRRPETAFPWHLFETHQITWMQNYTGTGGLSIALIYHVEARVMSAYIFEYDNYPLSLKGNINQGDISTVIMEYDKDNGIWTGWNQITLYCGYMNT